MLKRDAIGAFIIYLLSAEIVVTGASLLFNSIPLFWVGQLVAVVGALMVTALTFNAHTKDD